MKGLTQRVRAALVELNGSTWLSRRHEALPSSAQGRTTLTGRARLSADNLLLFMRFRELKPATTPHRVGTRRFSSSAQFSTTVSPAVSAWVPVLGA